MDVRELDRKQRHISRAGEYHPFCVFFREPRSTLPHPNLENKCLNSSWGKRKSSLSRKKENQWPSKTAFISRFQRDMLQTAFYSRISSGEKKDEKEAVYLVYRACVVSGGVCK